jgi:hypothetical protein
MFAIFAVIVFALGFLLQLLSVDVGRVSLVLLGLALFAMHFVVAGGVPWRRNPQ